MGKETRWFRNIAQDERSPGELYQVTFWQRYPWDSDLGCWLWWGYFIAGIDFYSV